MTEPTSEIEKCMIRPCEWDSKTFGRKVFAVFVNRHTEVKKLRYTLSSEEPSLAYVFVNPDDEEIIPRLQSAGAKLVDDKMTYGLDLSIVKELEHSLARRSHPSDLEPLRPLAFEAGKFSRFRLDPFISERLFQFIYSEWLRKSLSGQFDNLVLVKEGIPETSANRPQGMVTLRFTNDIARIGLISVSPELQGNGIGRILLSAAASESASRGFRKLIVSTQRENGSANRFYDSFGFRLENSQKILHWWLD